jgi:hypothetical protein
MADERGRSAAVAEGRSRVGCIARALRALGGVGCLGWGIVGCGPLAPAGTDAASLTEGTYLVVTTTDFATGAVSVVDVDREHVHADVAFGSTDAIPFTHEGLVYVVHRWGIDRVDVLDPRDGFRLLAQHPVEVPGVASPNAHALAFDARGRGLLALYEAPELQIWDFTRPVGDGVTGRVDLSAFADADGSPETGELAVVGDEAWLFMQRLDRTHGWIQSAPDLAVVVDLQRDELVDLDLATPGVQGIELPGGWPRQVRRGEGDDAQVLYALSTGILRVDTAARTVSWAVSPEQFAEIGIAHHLLPQSFDFDDEGGFLVAAYDADFRGVTIWRFSGAGGTATIGSASGFASGLDAVERTLEVVDGRVWFGDTRHTSPGMRRWWMHDADGEAGALGTGLPPYSITRLDLE